VVSGSLNIRDLIFADFQGPVTVVFGTWNVRSLCTVGAIKSVVGELEKYKLHLVAL